MPILAQHIRQFCIEHGLKLSHTLGQHFLIDERVLQAVIEAANIQPTDHIVEIGPGIGILTKELVKHAAKVTAIELDERFIPLLRAFVTSNFQYVNILKVRETVPRVPAERLTVIQGDALQADFPQEPYKIVANIPYHITSPLLRHAFRESKVHPTTMTLLIQREVAEKICLPFATLAKKGRWDDAGLLTILVGLFGTPQLTKIVPPGAFLPPPKVDSAILHIACFPESLAPPDVIDEVFRLTKIAFGQKRKMLRKTMGGLPGGMQRLEKARIDPTRRPQTLSIEEWIRVARSSL